MENDKNGDIVSYSILFVNHNQKWIVEVPLKNRMSRTRAAGPLRWHRLDGIGFDCLLLHFAPISLRRRGRPRSRGGPETRVCRGAPEPACARGPPNQSTLGAPKPMCA